MSSAMLQCSPVGRCPTAPFQGSTKALRAAGSIHAHRSVYETQRHISCNGNGQQHPMVSCMRNRERRTSIQAVLLHSLLHANEMHCTSSYGR